MASISESSASIDSPSRQSAAAATSIASAPAETPSAARSSLLARVSFWCAWALLGLVFACAYVQGAAFAATKDSATVWGALIGLAAFFAWLSVDEEDHDDGDDDGDDDDDEHAGGPKEGVDQRGVNDTWSGGLQQRSNSHTEERKQKGD